MAGRVAEHQHQRIVAEAEGVVVVAAGHHDRPVAEDLDLRRLVAGDQPIAGQLRQVAGNDRLLKLADRFDLLAELVGQELRPAGLHRLVGRFDHGRQQHDELAGRIAEHVGVQPGQHELGETADLAREIGADDGHIRLVLPQSLKEGVALVRRREAQRQQDDIEGRRSKCRFQAPRR